MEHAALHTLMTYVLAWPLMLLLFPRSRKGTSLPVIVMKSAAVFLFWNQPPVTWTTHIYDFLVAAFAITISTGTKMHPFWHFVTFCGCVFLQLVSSSKVSVVMVVIEWALGARPLICGGMFPGIISGDCVTHISSPRTLIWTPAIILFAQAVLMH